MTKIEWCEETWNPILGCQPVSPGCANCYAARQASRGLWEAHAKVATGGRWNGRVERNPVTGPGQWRRPKRVFVGSMTDLFWEEIPSLWVVKVLREIEAAKQHTFMLLTKRAERMRRFFEDAPPPPNLWLGVSVENQETADERIPPLLETPAALRFVSVEPLLGPVEISDGLHGYPEQVSGREYVSREMALDAGDPEMEGSLYSEEAWEQTHPPIDWVIVGGESGPRARPCEVEWIRSLMGQCREASVPCFVKQLGTSFAVEQPDWGTARRHDRKGGDMAEWPEDLRVRDFPRMSG